MVNGIYGITLKHLCNSGIRRYLVVIAIDNIDIDYHKGMQLKIFVIFDVFLVNAQWVETMQSTHSIHRLKSLSHELRRERVSERVYK